MEVSATRLAWLCLAALLAGMVNAIAGGGTLLTFPALLGVVPPVIANATSTVALVPASCASAWGFRRELAATGRWALLLLVPSVVGGAAGALLLTQLDEKYFAFLVPWLILTATLLLLVQPTVARLLKVHTAERPPGVGAIALIILFQFGVAVYGGYFGAGIGILMLGALAFMGLGNIHRTNALKAVLALAINGVSVIVFVVNQRVNWSLALPMAAAAILGGYLGARLSLRLRPGVVRWIVIGIGFAMAGWYFLGSTPTPASSDPAAAPTQNAPAEMEQVR